MIKSELVYVYLTVESEVVVKTHSYEVVNINSAYNSLCDLYNFDYANDMSSSVSNLRVIYEDGNVEDSRLNVLASALTGKTIFDNCVLCKEFCDEVISLSFDDFVNVLNKLRSLGVEYEIKCY